MKPWGTAKAPAVARRGPAECQVRPRSSEIEQRRRSCRSQVRVLPGVPDFQCRVASRLYPRRLIYARPSLARRDRPYTITISCQGPVSVKLTHYLGPAANPGARTSPARGGCGCWGLGPQTGSQCDGSTHPGTHLCRRPGSSPLTLSFSAQFGRYLSGEEDR